MITSKQSILIAEDEPVMRMALVEASDGCEAIETIEQELPELVILDLLMPKMDGFDVLKAIQRRRESGLAGPPDPKVVVLSALNELHLVETLRQLGAHQVLMKPLHIDEIIDLVRDETTTPQSVSATPEPTTIST
jgi:CheY-like chemotaxis protein